GKTGDPTRAPLRPWLWGKAEDILPRKNVGDFNQALMELGALVCTPAAPACETCPLRARCVARAEGLQGSIPFRPVAPKVVDVREAAVVLLRGDAVLLVRRPASAARWANLWEFPHGELREGETYEQGAARLLLELTGLAGTVGPEVRTIRHGVTRFR